MSEEVKSFIDKLAQNDMVGAGDAFKDALRAKVGDQLDAKRQDVASNLFKAEPHSDPKPDIAGTGTFTKDGQVEPTGATAQEQEPTQEVPNEVEPVSAEQPDIQ
jgi:hypothetical protein